MDGQLLILWKSKVESSNVMGLSFTFRCSEFGSKLEGYNKELEGFRKREVMTTEEMKNNVEKLHELSKNLDQALVEFEVWSLGVWGWRLMIVLSCWVCFSVLYFLNITCQVDSIDWWIDQFIHWCFQLSFSIPLHYGSFFDSHWVHKETITEKKKKETITVE